MTDANVVLNANHLAVEEFLATARGVPAGAWAVPRAPGKWSPGQVAEHVARAYEVNGALFRGEAPGGLPKFLRPLVRRFLLGMVLRKGDFPRGSRSPAIMKPDPTPAAQPVVIAQIEAAAREFEAEAGKRSGSIEHPFFGQVPVTDMVRLQEIHTRHHRRQLTTDG